MRLYIDSIFVCILNENGILFQDKIRVLTPDLERLVVVLHEHGATEVCMESTSIYWMPTKYNSKCHFETLG